MSVVPATSVGSMLIRIVPVVGAFSKEVVLQVRVSTRDGRLDVYDDLACHPAQRRWAGRLLDVLGDLPGAEGEGSLAAFSLFFVVGPVVSLGLLLSGAARRWFTATPPA